MPAPMDKILGAPARFRINIFRMCRTLARSDIGHVTSQTKTGGKSNSSRITYTFTDQSGLECPGEGTDYTKKYLEGMPVIVFFDRSDSKESVAACCTTWKLKSPDGKFLDLY